MVQTKPAGWSPASQDKKVAVAGFISKGEKPEGRWESAGARKGLWKTPTY